ncbi:MAG: PilZ domain-containing protein [Candidatus Zixiibacteriota bacterium]
MDTVSGVGFQDHLAINVSALDLSSLVGREIKLFSEQFPGKEIMSRVVLAQERELLIDSGGKSTQIDNLVHGQTVILQFAYRGQAVSVKASLRRSSGNRCHLILDDRVTPLCQRKFRRIPIERAVRLAAFPPLTFRRKNLSRLRWIETHLINFSSGGALVTIPGYLERGVYLLVSIDLGQGAFPPMVLGQVRHCYAIENGAFHVGMEFVVSEVGKRQLPPPAMKELPAVVLSYDARQRESLNKKLLAWTPTGDNQQM